MFNINHYLNYHSENREYRIILLEFYYRVNGSFITAFLGDNM